MQWMARAVQQPASQGEVAVVLRGRKGVGKGVTAGLFGSLFGRHYLHVTQPSHVAGHFNAHLRDAVVVFFDEAAGLHERKVEAVVKTLITESTFMVEAKGVDPIQAPNYVHLLIASNEQHVVPATEDERRYFVLEVNDARRNDTAYFTALVKAMNDGGRAKDAPHHLLTLDHRGLQCSARAGR